MGAEYVIHFALPNDVRSYLPPRSDESATMHSVQWHGVWRIRALAAVPEFLVGLKEVILLAGKCVAFVDAGLRADKNSSALVMEHFESSQNTGQVCELGISTHSCTFEGEAYEKVIEFRPFAPLPLPGNF